MLVNDFFVNSRFRRFVQLNVAMLEHRNQRGQPAIADTKHFVNELYVAHSGVLSSRTNTIHYAESIVELWAPPVLSNLRTFASLVASQKARFLWRFIAGRRWQPGRDNADV